MFLHKWFKYNWLHSMVKSTYSYLITLILTIHFHSVIKLETFLSSANNFQANLCDSWIRLTGSVALGFSGRESNDKKLVLHTPLSTRIKALSLDAV